MEPLSDWDEACQATQDFEADPRARDAQNQAHNRVSRWLSFKRQSFFSGHPVWGRSALAHTHAAPRGDKPHADIDRRVQAVVEFDLAFRGRLALL
jgi:hypothetical protein